jgi:hypothetical protein
MAKQCNGWVLSGEAVGTTSGALGVQCIAHFGFWKASQAVWFDPLAYFYGKLK